MTPAGAYFTAASSSSSPTARSKWIADPPTPSPLPFAAPRASSGARPSSIALRSPPSRTTTTSSRCSRSSSNHCPTTRNRTPDGVIERTIWPLRTAVGRDGHVKIGTHDLAELADRYGTPLYVYDAETIRTSLREYVDAFFRYRPVRVAYSVKACALIGVGAVIAREGVDASVASLGELEAARKAGFPASRMELHGNAKPDDEVAAALEARVGRFVFDGAHDVERLARLTHGRRRPQPVWLRVAPGIKVDTHPHLVTGTVDSKFGAPISTGEALTQAREISRAKGLALVGIHAHIGAQVRDARPYGELARALVAFASEVRGATGAPISELGMGGGVAVRLRSTEEAPELDDYARAVTQPVRKDRAL